LAATAGNALAEDPGLAAEIWFALDRHGKLPASEPSWSPHASIPASGDANRLIRGMRDRARRESGYEIARRTREDWGEIFATALWHESESRSLDYLSSQLVEGAPQLFDSFFDQALSQPRKGPAAFTWLAERSAEKEAWQQRNPLRLLQQILWALDSPDFAPFRTRLVNLCESGGTLPRLLNHLSEDQAERTLESIDKAGGLADYQREPLVNAIELRFSSLRQEDQAPLYATAEVIEDKRGELKKLAEVEIPANRQAIEEARAMGDLRENFEYKAARQRHEYLSARASALSSDLTRVRPIDVSVVSGKEVVIGSRTTLETDGGGRVVTILGPWNSEPEKDILSNESDLAKAMLGAKPGDKVELPDGVTYRIASIEPYI